MSVLGLGDVGQLHLAHKKITLLLTAQMAILWLVQDQHFTLANCAID